MASSQTSTRPKTVHTDFEKVPNLAPTVKRGVDSTIGVFDPLEGADQQTVHITAKRLHDELGATHQGIKSHEVGEGNVHTGNFSLTYGEDNLTGIGIPNFTCVLDSKDLLIAGLDVTDDFRIGDVVRVVYGDNTLYKDRVVNGSTYDGIKTTITLDEAVTGIVRGVLKVHGHGVGVANFGMNNQIKGDRGGYFGTGGRVLRDILSFLGTGINNWFSHAAGRGMGYDGDTHWSGEDYRAFTKVATNGDRKNSIVMMGITTTDATPTSLTMANGTLLVLPDGHSAYFEVKATGSQSGGAGGTVLDTYVTHIRGSVKNIGGAITIIDQEEAYTSGDAALAGTITVAEDDVNHALNIIATGQATKNITWTAKVEFVMNVVAQIV